MDGKRPVTDEMIHQAKGYSLTEVARRLGFTPVRTGNCHSLKEMDSMRIYHDRTWNRFSGKGNRTGGSTIDFMLEFGGCASFQDAVLQLLSIAGNAPIQATASRKDTEPKPEKRPGTLELPRASNSQRRLYAYLIKTRCLSQKVVDHFTKDRQILYEDAEHHNLVFLGKDCHGNTRYATKRGTMDAYGKGYRGDVSGSDKTYGVSLPNRGSAVVKVFESCIDMMSYMDITGDYESCKVALGGLSDNPLLRFLEEYPGITQIAFSLDNDKAAGKAIYGYDYIKDGVKEHVSGLYEKYGSVGYQVSVEVVPRLYGKDFNEYLVNRKKTGALVQGQEIPAPRKKHNR